MKTRIFLITLFFLSPLLSGCSLQDSSDAEPLPPAPADTPAPKAEPVQNEPDDTPPPPPNSSNGAAAQDSSYSLIEKALAEKNDLLTTEFTLGIRHLTLDHFSGTVAGKEGKILAARKGDKWKIVFDGVYGKEKTYTCSSVAEYNFPEDMIMDCVDE